MPYIDLYSQLHTCTNKYDAYAELSKKLYNVTSRVLHLVSSRRRASPKVCYFERFYHTLCAILCEQTPGNNIFGSWSIGDVQLKKNGGVLLGYFAEATVFGT